MAVVVEVIDDGAEVDLERRLVDAQGEGVGNTVEAEAAGTLDEVWAL